MSKQPRGLHRQFRRFAQSHSSPAPLDLDGLVQRGYNYHKIGLAPWRGASYASNPPGRFRQLVVQGLLITFQHWQTQLAGWPEPYYLALWIMENRFRNSQVVAAVGSRLGRYEQMFGSPAPTAPALPADYARLPGVEHLLWTAYFPEEPVWPEELPPGTPAHLYRTATTETEETYYLRRGAGHVWVGQAAP